MARTRILFLLFGASLVAEPAVAGAGTPYHQLAPEPLALALTPGVADGELAALLDGLEADGVRVPVAVSGAGLILVDRPDLDAVLARQGVRHVLRDPLPGGRSALPADPRAGGLLRWWSGGFAVPAPPTVPPGAIAGEEVRICSGAPLLRDMLAQRRDARCGAAQYGTVHFAAGRCVVNLVFPQSTVGGAVPWSGARMAQVSSELLRALNWWSLKSGHSLRFVLVEHGAAPTAEDLPALDVGEEQGFVTDCLTALGYTTTSCAYSQLNEMNETTRLQHRAHWAFSEFVLDLPGTFPGGGLAYAYLGGPVTVARYGNGNLGPQHLDHVMAHEIGHIFQAVDEYLGTTSPGCQGSWGYLSTPNNNSLKCPSPVSRCLMRGTTEYSPQEMDNLENVVQPCIFTKRMAGIWDSDGDGIWDVRETFPSTEILTAVPDTVDNPQTVRVTGHSWDNPYPAPPRYRNPVTINRIVRVEFRTDGNPWQPARALDGIFTDVDEEWELALPRLGGGLHALAVRAVNTMGFADAAPALAQFFVHDVELRDELFVSQEGPDLAVSWRVDGEDFGSRYTLSRTNAETGARTDLAEIPSQGGRNDRFVYRDRTVVAGEEYIYGLAVDIPGKGRKDLGIARQTATLAPPLAGRIVSLGPNPTRGSVLLSVSIPRGPRPSRGDVILPGEQPSPAFRDGDSPGGGPPDSGERIWRDVRILVYDVRGGLVRDLGTFRHQEMTRFNAEWDGRDESGALAPTGVYFVRVRLDYTETIEKVVVVR